MNPLTLICTKCGSPLDFENLAISVCQTCQTPNVLVGQKDNFYFPYSFIPYIQNKDGKMEISLKILLARKIRDECKGKFFVVTVSDKGIFESYDGLIPDNDDRLAIGIPAVREETVYYGIFSKKKKVLRSDITTICGIYVLPVRVKYNGIKILAGHRLYIQVYKPEFESNVAELTKLIQEWFETVPEVHLEVG